MKLFFVLALSFVFAVQINGQGYIGRQRKVVPPPKAAILQRHDPIAVEGGHRILNQAINDAAQTIDIGSAGALSMGDPFAQQAAQGLAREMVHVAGKKLGMAPQSKSVIHPQPIHPQPIHPQPILPHHPKPGKPIKPIHHQPILPVQPILPKPGKPIYPQPIKPIHPQPILPVHQPILPKPGKPIYPQPIKPKHTQPILPVHQPILPKPGKPIYPQPIKPIHPQPILPVQPIHPPKPVKPIKPVLPVHPKPILPKPIAPKPVHPKPVLGGFAGGLGGMQGGGHGPLPLWVRRLIGKTITGDIIVGGQNGWPRHGGAGAGEAFKNGLRNGWGGNPSAPVVQAVSAWSDPLRGHIFPTDYNGGELLFDDDAGHFVMKSQAGAAAGHQVAKASGLAPLSPHIPLGAFGPGIGSVPIIDPVHDAVKGAHVGVGGIGGIGKPIGGGSPVHNVHKVGKSGIVATRHDPVAADIGHQTAKHIANKATHTINMATGGGVARGDPFATSAAHGLAREAAHVTNQELALASGIAATGHLGGVGGVIQPGLVGHGVRPVLPKKKPVVPAIHPPFPTGYGRTRKGVAAKAW